jgi:hypothetical protein
MEEVWKDIAGYEGKYQVSNLGRVRSIGRNTICDSDHRRSHYVRSLDGKILKQSMTNDGYFRVSLYDKDNKLKYVPVHRLVARAFVDGYKEGMQVNHINEMKFVNCAVNLEWVTPSQNINYGERNKKSVKTRRNHAHNPKVIQLNDEGIPICEYNSQTEAAEVNGIPRTRLCRAMKEGSKYKGYYWKFKE